MVEPGRAQDPGPWPRPAQPPLEGPHKIPQIKLCFFERTVSTADLLTFWEHAILSCHSRAPSEVEMFFDEMLPYLYWFWKVLKGDKCLWRDIHSLQEGLFPNVMVDSGASKENRNGEMTQMKETVSRMRIILA